MKFFRHLIDGRLHFMNNKFLLAKEVLNPPNFESSNQINFSSSNPLIYNFEVHSPFSHPVLSMVLNVL